RERFLARLIGAERVGAHLRLLHEERVRLRAARAGRQIQLAGDDLTAARRAAHAAARAETEPRSSRDVIDGARVLGVDRVANLGREHGLARTYDLVLGRALEHVERARAVTEDEPPRGDRRERVALRELERVDGLLSAGQRFFVRRADARRREIARDDVAHLLREEAKARELAADHRVDAGRV